MQNTPYYFYDLELLNQTMNEIELNIRSTNYKIHYAIKANNNKKILSFIAKRNFGADCVSAGEIMLALESGFDPADIVFAGVGKSDEEIEYALLNNVGMLHCEGLQELEVIHEIANRLNRVPKVALRLNPDVNAQTHEKISTGTYENKFGFSPEEFADLIDLAPNLTNIELVGLHFHIGSQITNISVFASLAKRINELIPVYEKYFGTIRYLNVGGGLGVDYQNPDVNPIADFKSYFETFHSTLNTSVPVHFELGRSIVAQCGSLRTKVLYIKRSGTKTFAVVDAGMTELLRPAMYDAYHKIEKLNDSHLAPLNASNYDVVGPLCESSDFFGKNVALPELHRGDILSIRSCGAYAESMSLNYNGRSKAGSITNDPVLTQFRIIKAS